MVCDWEDFLGESSLISSASAIEVLIFLTGIIHFSSLCVNSVVG